MRPTPSNQFQPTVIDIARKNKLNANIGACPNSTDAVGEVKKLSHVCKYSAATVIDFSTGGAAFDEDGFLSKAIKFWKSFIRILASSFHCKGFIFQR